MNDKPCEVLKRTQLRERLMLKEKKQIPLDSIIRK
jgi:hypothetical protein